MNLSETVQAAQPYPHYFKALPAGCTHIDVYRVLSLFEVIDPALQHAVKKLLCAGARGAKDQAQDISEAIATLQRWQQMRAEEEQPAPAAAPEDAERAAHLARWKDAPEWANWCSEDASGRCDWLTDRPRLNSLGSWEGGLHCYAGHNLLGCVRVEPRPTRAGGQGVEG